MERSLTMSLLIVFAMVSIVTSDPIYVIPDPDTPCPATQGVHVPCPMLAQLADSGVLSSMSNVTLLLLPGNHNLVQPLTFQDITSFEVRSLTTESNHSTVPSSIDCSGIAGLVFENIGQVRINSVSFFGCKSNKAAFVNHLVIEDSLFDGQDVSGSALEIKEVSNATIISAVFASNFKVGSNDENGLYMFTRSLSSDCLGINFFLDQVGGAIIACNSVINIYKSLFTQNGARIGGAMYIAISNVTITDCIFSNNTANSGGEETDIISTGGALYSVGSRVTIESSTFDNNTAFRRGGAIFNGGHLTIINDNVFSDNLAHTDGGAVYNNYGTLTIDTNNSFWRNHAFGTGGAIYNYRVLSVVNGNSFGHNSASVDGGALYNYGSLTVSDGNSFTDNTANGNGGALFNNGELEISNGNVFSRNTAQRNGGVVYNAESNLNITMGNEFSNNSAVIDGGAIWAQHSYVTIEGNVTFIENSAYGDGGALWIRSTILFIKYSNKFYGNTVAMDGGAVWSQYSSLSIGGHNLFSHNLANTDGGAILSQFGNLTIYNSNLFDSNRAEDDGGAIVAWNNEVTQFKNGNTFINNVAMVGGGAVWLWNIDVSFSGNEFVNNTASNEGGALVVYLSRVTLTGSHIFTSNIATDGAAVFIYYSQVSSDGHLNISENAATCAGTVYVSRSSLSFSGQTEFVNNFGSFYANFDSMITFTGNTTFESSSSKFKAECTRTQLYGQAGALTQIGGELALYDNVTFTNNEADIGGAILAKSNSSIVVHGHVSVYENTAQSSGGGLAIFQSEMNVNGEIFIAGNRARETGGGISTVEATIRILNDGSLQLIGNSANLGGGVYLEQESKLLVVTDPSHDGDHEDSMISHAEDENFQFQFVNNSASYGGAVYVDDNSNPSVCASTAHLGHSPDNECFFQVLLQDQSEEIAKNDSHFHFYFLNNSASVAGASIYGGLLDRCKIRSFMEHSQEKILIQSIDYLRRVSNLNHSDVLSQISSNGVRVCFCEGEVPDCTLHLPPVQIQLGQTLRVSAVAVDQVNNTLPATVHSSLVSIGNELIGTLLSRNTSTICTQLEYDIVTPYMSQSLVLYAEGPCNDVGISQRSIGLEFQSCLDVCPKLYGFQPSSTNLTTCQCECHKDLPFITNCSSATGYLERKGNYWIGLKNGTQDSNTTFMSTRFCPYDYCLPAADSVLVNLNDPKGSDAQCAFNRSGKVCGSCKEGFSVVFGSNRCKSCSNTYLGLLVLFVLAGIALVVFLITCNLTVAVGTINGLIFYANIVVAYRVVFFPFEVTSFLTVFISWLSLNLGIETCFYNGMDGYAKVWWQFAFDIYLILLVVTIIIMCHYSQRLSNFLSSRNPVATLVTLILFACEKLTRKLFSLLAFVSVSYSDGYWEVVWLFDPNQPYLRGRHIALLILFLFIFVFGCVFNFLLLFGHCLTRLPNRRIFRWIRHPKFITFMDAYQAPYNPRHRYWFGLLLFVRQALYLFLEINAAGDAGISLLAIATVGIGLLSFKVFVSRIYKSLVLDILETSFIINLTMFAVFTVYIRETNKDQGAIAHTSFTVVLLTFIGILIYHTFKYSFKNTFVQKYLDQFFKHVKETLLKRNIIAASSMEKNALGNQTVQTGTIRSLSSSLQGPLGLISHHPTISEYRQAEYSSSQPADVSHAIVEIIPDTPPLSRMLGHDTADVVMDRESTSASSSTEADKLTPTTLNTGTTVTLTLSSVSSSEAETA